MMIHRVHLALPNKYKRLFEQNHQYIIVQKEDLYKNDTLLLKKGSILNSYVLNKLYNFGLENIRIGNEKNKIKILKKQVKKDILIIQKSILDIKRTQNILNYAGYQDNVLTLQNIKNLIDFTINNGVEINFVKYLKNYVN